MVVRVHLYGNVAGGRKALVDDDCAELIRAYRWYADRSNQTEGSILYAVTNNRQGLRPRKLRMHRLIAGWSGKVDHIDGDGLNNQRSNLRPATSAQNSQNMRAHPGTSSVFKGVSWRSDMRKWRACIRIAGHLRHLGTFADAEDAARAYDAAASEAWGEYARLNLPA